VEIVAALLDVIYSLDYALTVLKADRRKARVTTAK